MKKKLTNYLRLSSLLGFLILCGCVWINAAAISSHLRPAVLPSFVYGITIDSVFDYPPILKSISELGVRPTVRIVFDELVPANEYLKPAQEIHRVAFTLGELLDSKEMVNYTLESFKERTREYYATLKNHIDVWEIGNEVNGEWLGDSSGVMQKISYAADLVKAGGGSTAVTVYYNVGCWQNPKNEVFRWIEENMDERIKTQMDYVLFSYYDEDCNFSQPNWEVEFKKLSNIFPRAYIGFGEVGAKSPLLKERYINHYYTMKIANPAFIGGFFWWYFRQDMVPHTKPLLGTMKKAISDSRRPH